MVVNWPRLAPSGLTARWRFVVISAVLFSLLIGGAFGLLKSKPTSSLNPHAESIISVEYRLRNLTLGSDGRVIGSRGKDLYRIVNGGDATEHMAQFEHVIQGVHVMQSGHIVVATDNGPWDPKLPCTIYLLDADGGSPKAIKELDTATALWWSLASDANGTLYVGEYGPRQAGMARNVWRTTDYGTTWSIVFRAPERDGVHVHRVAVDPYTQDVWVTLGDGKENRGIHRSRDGGENFESVLDSQATAIAFTPDAIYWGEDHRSQGRITRYNRDDGGLDEVLRASRHGPYGGSVYDMTVTGDQTIYAPTMKYPQQGHTATLWRGREDNWELIAELPIGLNGAVGVETIAGPDRDGWIYLSGYKLHHNPNPPPG